MQPALILLLIVLGAGVVLLWARVRRRTRQFTALAHRLRLKFTAYDTIGLADRFCALHLMHLGHSQRFCNIVHGHLRERRVMLGEVRYEIGAGIDRSIKSYTFAACCLPQKNQGKQPFPQMAVLQGDTFRPIGRFQYFNLFCTGVGNIDKFWKLYSDKPDDAVKLWKGAPPALPSFRSPLMMELQNPYIVFYVDAPLSTVAAAHLLKHALRWSRFFQAQLGRF